MTAWLGEGRPVALARVVEVVGSGVQPAGAALAVNADGQVAGSASGGCVEGALVEQTRAALTDDGRPRLTTFGCTDDEAFDVGLTCGGTLRVLIERLSPPVPWLDALDKALPPGPGPPWSRWSTALRDSSGPKSCVGAGRRGDLPGRRRCRPRRLRRSRASLRPPLPWPPSLRPPSTTPWPTWPRAAAPPTVMRRRRQTKRR